MRGKPEPAGTSQNYQRFAWGTLALAAVVALAGTDRGTDPVTAPVAATFVADAAISAPKMARPAFAAINPQPIEEPEQAEADAAAPGDELAGAEAQGPGVAGTEASPAAPQNAGPADAAQAGQLVSSSRIRSGGIAQGDDPGARQVN